jgi:AraC family transcriptional regulator
MAESLAVPDSFNCVVEERRQVPGAIVEVRNFCWLSEQDLTATFSKPYLDLALSARAPGVEGAYVDTAHEGDRQRFGELIFLPAGSTLHSRWRAGRQRSVCCEFDIEQLEQGEQVYWGDYELNASLDVRNVFIREAMLRLAREILAPGFGSDILIESLCRVLAVEVPRHFSLLRWRETQATSKLTAAQLKRIEARVLSADTPFPTVAELAADCGMSSRHFSRVFRDSTGYTVGAFVTQRRIEAAKAALANRSATIKQIAYHCGFQSIPAFSAAFRRETGLAPGQFRAAVLASQIPEIGHRAKP